MRWSFIPILAGLAIARFGAPATAETAVCTAQAPCSVPTGTYLLHAPSGWDGKTALPTMMFFHGYRSSAANEMANPEMTRFADETNTLLIVPNGLNGQWSFPSSPHPGRDEFAFVAAVLDDVEKRVPVDQTRLWASGFSIGGSMTWYIACYLGNRFAAFAPIAGSFWDPAPSDCPSGPANIRHIHGLSDRTVPLEGRAIGTSFRQGDTWVGLSMWKHINACKPEPTRIEKETNMICRIWQNCGSGKELRLCLHPGEHEIWTDWLRDDSRWVDELAKAGQLAKHATNAAP
jgi:polyhydroxybutyrate depolymerase